MAIKIDSEASCRAAYIDYYTNENTKVSAEDMRRIVQRYDDATRKSWQVAFTKASNDENRYEFDDEQFEDIRLESFEETEDEYGDGVNVKTEKARNVGDGIGSGLAGLGALAGAFGGSINLGSGMMKLFNLGAIGTIISCVSAFIVGLSYKLNKANEEEVAAVNELYSEMETQQETINEKESEIKEIQDDIQDASDKATKENDDANDDIKKLAGTHTFYTNSYLYLQSKIDRGESLSPTEMMQYKEVVKMMNSTSSMVQTRSEDASVVLQENKDAISGFESDFDGIAGSLADVQGTTDYAASIDEATQKSCKTEAVLHGINAASGASSALKAFAKAGKNMFTGPVGWALAAIWGVLGGLATTGALFSAKAVKEQTKFANDAGQEIALRVETQDANANATANLEEGVDNFNTTKAVIDTEPILNPNDLVKPKTVHVNPFTDNG